MEYRVSQAPATSTDSAPGHIDGARRSWLIRRGLLLESGPQRKLALAGFVNQLGTAAFLTTVPLYAHQVIHLSIGQVGLGLSVAGVVGLIAGIPVGHLADRRGPRDIFVITLLIQALSMLSLLFAHSAASAVTRYRRSAPTCDRWPCLPARSARWRPVRWCRSTATSPTEPSSSATR
ncbi:MFS transporter [Streptomyces piniterrae]|uniref:MFS transporter n=1 Tax=Streptomyces piniterrae TaxID=2571125 RepID=UPI001C9E383E